MTTEDVARRIDGMLETPADHLVEYYFDREGPFAGELFDVLGDNEANALGTDDLVAIALHDVKFRPQTVRALLDENREEVRDCLAAISPTLEIWDAADADFEAAAQLWRLLHSLPGVNRILAGKILARKRPHFIPVIDGSTIAALRAPTGQYWQTIGACLADPERRSRIEELRPVALRVAPALERVTTLRLLDVAIWMRVSESEKARTCRSSHGLPVQPRMP